MVSHGAQFAIDLRARNAQRAKDRGECAGETRRKTREVLRRNNDWEQRRRARAEEEAVPTHVERPHEPVAE